MKLLRKTFALLLLLAVITVVKGQAAEGAGVKNVRAGIYGDKTRIVVDLDEAAKYAAHWQNGGLVITLQAALPAARTMEFTNGLVSKVTAEKLKGGETMLTVETDGPPAFYKVFTLQQPARLVIDLHKYVLERKVSELDRGLRYIFWRDVLAGRPVRLHVLEIDAGSEYSLRPILGGKDTIERGRLSRMALQEKAAAAVNASYFDKTKWIIGNLKLDGQWVSADSVPRSALLLPEEGTPRILPDIAYAGSVTDKRGKTVAISGMNRERQTNELIIYNRFYGKSTLTNGYGYEVRVRNGVVAATGKTGNMELTEDAFVLSGHGTSAEFLKRLRKGERLLISQTLQDADADRAIHVIGAGPLLVSGGKAKVTAREELFPADIARGRAPRTAVGIKPDGGILLVVAEGRTALSGGLTLEELAGYLLKMGARDALNFDGGGSSGMVVRNEQVNTPPDGSERLIRSGLAVVRRQVRLPK